MAPTSPDGGAPESSGQAPRTVPGSIRCSSCLGVAFHSAERRRTKKVSPQSLLRLTPLLNTNTCVGSDLLRSSA